MHVEALQWPNIHLSSSPRSKHYWYLFQHFWLCANWSKSKTNWWSKERQFLALGLHAVLCIKTKMFQWRCIGNNEQFKGWMERDPIKWNVQLQKISILPPQKGLKFSGGWGFCKAKKVKKYMKLNWNFQRGGVGA